MGEDLIIVDGYNIINAWPELIKLKNESFEHARDRLLNILSDFCGLTGCLVIVVFDAHLVKGGIGHKEILGSIEVVFTQEGETADSCIERLVSQLPRETRVTVATSDWAQQRLVMGQGALRLSAREFLNRVNEAREKSTLKMHGLLKHNTTLDEALNPEMKEILEKWRRGK
ncbi:MAG: NYN domain-containing protein [Dehalobacterium sp.]